MPIIFEKNISDTTKVAIWDTTEDISFFVDALNLSIEELDFITNLRKHRLREWLSSRYLCNKILNSETRIPIIKDEFGKPHLENSSKFISISHSQEKAAVIISDKLVGIDIQKHVDRIGMIQHKFICDHERSHIDQENLIPSYHLFWGAKECMYKAYGKKEIKFKVHIKSKNCIKA